MTNKNKALNLCLKDKAIIIPVVAHVVVLYPFISNTAWWDDFHKKTPFLLQLYEI